MLDIGQMVAGMLQMTVISVVCFSLVCAERDHESRTNDRLGRVGATGDAVEKFATVPIHRASQLSHHKIRQIHGSGQGSNHIALKKEQKK